MPQHVRIFDRRSDGAGLRFLRGRAARTAPSIRVRTPSRSHRNLRIPANLPVKASRST